MTKHLPVFCFLWHVRGTSGGDAKRQRRVQPHASTGERMESSPSGGRGRDRPASRLHHRLARLRETRGHNGRTRPTKGKRQGRGFKPASRSLCGAQIAPLPPPRLRESFIPATAPAAHGMGRRNELHRARLSGTKHGFPELLLTSNDCESLRLHPLWYYNGVRVATCLASCVLQVVTSLLIPERMPRW